MECSDEALRFYVYTEYHCGTSAVEIMNKLKSVWGDKAASKATVYRWIAQCKDGSMQPAKGRSSGRPATTSSPENVHKVKELIDGNASMTVRLISEMTDIPNECVRTILRNQLNMRKICSVWMPSQLNDLQKEQRVLCCRNVLKVFHDLGESEFSRRFVSTDETWVHFSPIPWRNELKKWTARGDNRPRASQSKHHGNRTMLLIAYTHDAKFCIDGTVAGESVDSARYQAFVSKAIEKFRRERRGKINQAEIVWFQDNARPHVSRASSDFFVRKGISLPRQSPYSPDLNGCDRWVNKYLKQQLKARSYDTLEDLLQTAQQILNSIPLSRVQDELHKYIAHCNHVIQCHGDYTVC